MIDVGRNEATRQLIAKVREVTVAAFAPWPGHREWYCPDHFTRAMFEELRSALVVYGEAQGK